MADLMLTTGDRLRSDKIAKSLSGRGLAADITHLYVQRGWSLRELANRYNISKPTARQWLLLAGVTLRGRGGDNRQRRR